VNLSASDRAMLALRGGERSNIMIEEERIHGPEAAQPQADLLPGACIQLGSFNSIDWRDEEDMASWYAQWRLPSLKTLPGVIRVRQRAHRRQSSLHLTKPSRRPSTSRAPKKNSPTPFSKRSAARPNIWPARSKMK